MSSRILIFIKRGDGESKEGTVPKLTGTKIKKTIKRDKGSLDKFSQRSKMGYSYCLLLNYETRKEYGLWGGTEG